MTSSESTRKPYTGSCHCGIIKYIVHITFPPLTVPSRSGSDLRGTRIRKCNCTTCHKMGFFHVRLPDAENDFILLSPLLDSGSPHDEDGVKSTSAFGGMKMDGEEGLRDYTCFDAQIHWLFCSRCGVRCFSFAGEGRLVNDEEGKKVWKPNDGFREGGGRGYLSINASTLDAGQEGLDLREWHEKEWIVYLDCLDEKEEDRMVVPFPGGMY